MALDLKDCRFDGTKKFKISSFPTNAHADKADKEKYIELTRANTVRIGELQDKLYAQGREGLLVVFQAMDAAGKDSTIKRVMSGVNPQGVEVYSFKTPSKEELAHDYLWRAYTHLPQRGKIAIFNRSYYEDVLVVRVRDMRHGYAMPARANDMSDDEFFDARYRRLSGFEGHLYENGFRVLKFFLNVGVSEQEGRFLERIDNPAKNWKFSEGDLAERALWPAYMDAYERAINATSTKQAPWYVIPADQKWYMRWLVSEAIVRELEDMAPEYPVLPEDQAQRLGDAKKALLAVEDVEVAMLGRKAAEKAAAKARAKDGAEKAEKAEKAAKKAPKKAAKKAAKAKKEQEKGGIAQAEAAEPASEPVPAPADPAPAEPAPVQKAPRARRAAAKPAAKAAETAPEPAAETVDGPKKTAAKPRSTATRRTTSRSKAATATAAETAEKTAGEVVGDTEVEAKKAVPAKRTASTARKTAQKAAEEE